MKIAITGASGLIGSALRASLAEDGHQVLRLVRGEARSGEEAAWDPHGGRVDTSRLEDADAVVHLAGAPLGPRRWTAAYRKKIRESRVAGTRTLCEALAGMEPPVPRLLSASGINYYGDTGETAVDERAPRGEGFLAEVVAAWEGATAPAEEAGVAVSHLRTGVVLTGSGGMLATTLPLFRAGLGGRLGSGRQYMSWISLADHVAAMRFLLARPELTGAVNLCSPEPVTNAEYTRAVGSAVGRPTLAPVPKFALRAALGDFADEAALPSVRARPARLLEAGYTFRHVRLDRSLSEILAG